MAAVCNVREGDMTIDFGKYKGRDIREIPLDYLAWVRDAVATRCAASSCVASSLPRACKSTSAAAVSLSIRLPPPDGAASRPHCQATTRTRRLTMRPAAAPDGPAAHQRADFRPPLSVYCCVIGSHQK